MNTDITNPPLQIDHSQSPVPIPPIVLARRCSPIAATGLVALITFAILAGPTAVNAAGADKTTSKTKPPIVLPPLPPIPVTVEDGDVNVAGVVEVLNDALNEPYAKQFTGLVLANTSGDSCIFDVPDGKRLIVELVVIDVLTASVGARWSAFVSRPDPQNRFSRIGARLPVESLGISNFGTEAHSAAVPLPLRIDEVAGVTDELQINVNRSNTTGSANWSCSVHGYLVDL